MFTLQETNSKRTWKLMCFCFFVSRGLFQVLYFYVSFRGHTIFCLIFLATTFPCLSLHLFFLRSFVCEGVVLLGASEKNPHSCWDVSENHQNPSKSPKPLRPNIFFPSPRFWRARQTYVTATFLMDLIPPETVVENTTNHQGPGCRSHQWASMNLGQMNDGPEIPEGTRTRPLEKNRELQ